MKATRVLKRYIPEPFHPYLRKLKQFLRETIAGPRSYQDRIQAELAHYSNTPTVHDLPPIMLYWFNTHIIPSLQTLGFANSNEMFRSYIARVCREHITDTCVVLSIGAGDAATELNMAQWLLEQGIGNFQFECLDLNLEVLDRGRKAAVAKGYADRFTFSAFDINAWKPVRQYPIILAIQCLHHFVELELLFDKIQAALLPDGYFITDDMIGRNGHQRWPEALAHVEEFWKELPTAYRYNNALKCVEERFQNWDCSSSGFEGIRAQDILPLLMERFHFDLFFAFGNIVDVFVDRSFGPNFDPQKKWDRDFMDRVHAADVLEIESGRVKPTHLYAAMMKRASDNPKYYKNQTPGFCVRRPGC